MATVTVRTAAFVDARLDEDIVDGAFDLSGHLILTTRGGTDIDAGSPSFVVPDASDTVKGIVELATTAETSAGSDAVRAVTPAGLAGAISTVVPDSSTTVKGKVELATSTETTTGTDTVRAVTPAGLNAALVAYIAATVLNDLSDVVISSPAAGHTLQHNGTNWVNGVMTTLENEVAATGSTTSTTYTATLTSSTTPQQAFVAPPSGKVLIHWSCYSTHTVANGFAYMSFEVRAGATLGSGTVFLAASDTNAIANRPSGAGSVDDAQYGSSKLVTGLTPGSSYNIQGMYKIVTAGTGTFINRRIIVQPVM
jgi:hypothetical protein